MRAGRRINVNNASQAELEALPGVGPVIAWQIIEGRPNRSVDELDRVKGIGKKRLEEIRPLVTAESAASRHFMRSGRPGCEYRAIPLSHSRDSAPGNGP
jgi:hypothetical protein